MKILSRLFLILLISSVGIGAKAQIYPTNEKRVTLQLRGGLNISNVTAWDNHYDSYDNATPKIGFNLGGILDISLGKGIYLQPGLMLTSKGAKVDDVPIRDQTADATMNAIYLQVPVYVGYKFAFSNGNNIGVSAGPYFAYGVAGKTSFSERYYSGMTSIDTFNDSNLWNRPDAGIGIEVQFELKRIVFLMGGDIGLAKVWKRESLSHDIYVSNSNTYFSIGYKL
ncbi:PorT family protein [Dysgonomonas sp. Marseille-P4677]|uniref:porin family protein n=1 Tax=Dysgonomonas sp. Marseille-P4677 TaxID=2364790 RepID=UPI00191217A1|nr:porin family protein [Dysgonomonas sp. Marseille-P4677]MBK5722647.1 PorT family protein [Dysgonomonas sp. Marseille-P4677]